MRLTILLAALIFTWPVAAKTYRWVDDEGKVHYGDRVPAQYAQKTTQQLNSQGVVIQETNRAQTPEEIAAEQFRLNAEKQAKLAADEQKRYDDFLLSTYSTQDQIIVRRDEQISILDGRIASGNKSVEQSQASLDDLNKRAQGFVKNEKPVPDKLAEQISEFQRAVAEGSSALDTMKAEREKVFIQFDNDLERFLKLTGQQATLK